MQNEYYFIDDIWNIIKSYMIFNIHKDGHHLKDDKYHRHYNNIIGFFKKNIISLEREMGTPYMVHSSIKHNCKYIKYLYHIRHKNIRKLIIEYELFDFNSLFASKNGLSVEKQWYNNIYNNHNIYKTCHCDKCRRFSLVST